MATSLPKPAQEKRLSELLQEKQEPFLLDVYLLERGYSKKSLEGRSSCCTGNSSKNLRRSGRFGLRKRRNGIPRCSTILRSVLNKLVSVNDNRSMLNCDNTACEHGRSSATEMSGRTHQIAELDQFSSASSMTVFNSCSESDIEEDPPSSKQNPISSSSADTFRALKLSNLKEQEAATDRRLQWGCMEDSKQLSPVSILEEIPSDEDSPIYIKMGFCSRISKREIPSTSSFNLPKKVLEDCIISTSMWELLMNSLVEKQGCIGVSELQELLQSGSSSQYLKTKRVLEQTKQLLVDGIQEAVGTQRNNGRRRHVYEFLGAEELGKIICEQIFSWGKQSGNATNITQLLNSDSSGSTEKWSDFQPQIREIGMKIGDDILEDIGIEIVTDMIEFFYLKRC